MMRRFTPGLTFVLKLVCMRRHETSARCWDGREPSSFIFSLLEQKVVANVNRRLPAFWCNWRGKTKCRHAGGGWLGDKVSE
ncbi:MAG: hypothetical protein CMJ81_15940 [Planctomycetaceae bacterium]|nr:hypothetical protein [Planctomycetaceae bacterium]MBP62307.1 hypothetical protein [Planctomycetaceae bacterium]